MHRSLTLLAAFAVSTSASAMNGIVVDQSICDNQYVVMNIQWARSQPMGTDLKLFYYDGKNFHDATGSAPALSFDAMDNVYVDAHGNIDSISGSTGAAFATYFKAGHGTTPKAVNFLTCYAASPTSTASLSVLGSVAAQYPGQSPPATAIGILTGPTCPCALQGQANAIGAASMLQDVVTSAAGVQLRAQLVTAWESAFYPNTNLTYKEYCKQVITGPDYTKVMNFADQAIKEFSVKYLQLINSNSDGSPVLTCGANSGAACP